MTETTAAARQRIRAICPKRPLVRWPDFFGGSRGLAEPLGRDVRFTADGRSAIFHACHRLGIGPGQTLALPAYHCPSMVDPAIAAGVNIAYYAVNRDLTIDLAEIERTLDEGAKGVLLVHFFGLPGPVEEVSALCERYQVALIEDCCHSLFGSLDGRPLGSWGRAAVFSFRKTLPVHDGGALVLQGEGLEGGGAVRRWRSEARVVKQYLTDLLRPSTAAWMDLPAANPPGAEAASSLPDNRVLDFDPATADTHMTLASSRVLHSASPKRVRAARVRNYNALGERLSRVSGVRLLRPEVSPECSPMGFPFLVDSRERIDYALRRVGVPAFSFGEVLHPSLDRQRFPDAAYLSRHLAMIPVHQTLELDDIDRLASAVACSLDE